VPRENYYAWWLERFSAEECAAMVRAIWGWRNCDTVPACRTRTTARPTERRDMVLATAKIGDFDQFWNTFSTKGAEKRKQHGSKGAQVFRDPNDGDRVWVVFDWDEAGWQSFTSDPDVPGIFQEAGFTQGPPKSAEFLRQHEA
jgi:hypothetical protein